MERALHEFFGAVRMGIDVGLGDGKIARPKEWFCVPLKEIEKAVELLGCGKLCEYRYDDERCEVVKR